MYSFYQDLRKIIAKTRDSHFALDIENIKNYFLNYRIIPPIGFEISQENENVYLLGNILVEDEEIQKAFRNSETIFNIIEGNKYVKIKSINQMNPFDFISDY